MPGPEHRPPEYDIILDAGYIYRLNESEWEAGFQTKLRRQKVIQSLAAVRLDDAQSSFTGLPIFLSPFNNHAQMIELVKVGTPGACPMVTEYSPDGVRWWPLFSVNYSTSFQRLQSTSCLYPWVRTRISSSGLSAVNYWTVDVFDILNTHL